MSVIGVFCEDIDFPNGASVAAITAANWFRAGFARCAIRPSQVGYAQSTAFAGGSITSGWLCGQLYTDAQIHGGLGFTKIGTGSGFHVGGETGGSSSPLILFKVVNGVQSTLATSASVNISSNAIYRIDIQLINYGVTGTINVYCNGALAISYSGDISISGVSGFNAAGIYTPQTSGWWNAVSEIIVADESTLGWQGVDLREITANGTTQQWSNPDISNFDPVVINDNNSTYSNTAGQDEQAILANSVTGNFAIKAVKIVARANAPAGSAVTNLKLGLRNGAGVVGVGTAHALTTAFAPVSDLLTIDPTTGQPFTSIDGYQLDLRSA